MSSTSPAVGDKLMSTIAAQLGVSEPGRQWVTSAIDPYHDTALNVCGYPDLEESPSITQIVKSSYSISAPTSVTGNWDCHVSSFPWLIAGNVEALANDPLTNGGVLTPNNTTINANGMGGVMVDTVASTSTPTFTFQQTGSGTAQTFRSLDSTINQTFAVGEWRQIAHGFEVINTTSDLNIQGLVTTYASPFPQRSSKSTVSYLYSNAASTPPVYGSGAVSAVFTGLCPTNIADAMLLPGTRQWKAKEGAYVVPRLNNQDLSVGVDNTCMVVRSNDPNAPFTVQNLGITTVSLPTGTPIFTFQSAVARESFLTDFNWGGAYFTGLSNSTTLTVNITRIFERFPNTQIPSDVQLVPLAKPSPRYDF
jgi:hypothetical protein